MSKPDLKPLERNLEDVMQRIDRHNGRLPRAEAIAGLGPGWKRSVTFLSKGQPGGFVEVEKWDRDGESVLLYTQTIGGYEAGCRVYREAK